MKSDICTATHHLARQQTRVAEYVAAGNTVQFADAAWAEELRAWIRFDARTAVRTGDGLYGPVMGNPDVPPWLGRLFMKVALSGGYSREEANRRLAHQHGKVASFARALIEGLTAQQTDAQVDEAMDVAIQAIFEASRT